MGCEFSILLSDAGQSQGALPLGSWANGVLSRSSPGLPIRAPYGQVTASSRDSNSVMSRAAPATTLRTISKAKGH